MKKLNVITFLLFLVDSIFMSSKYVKAADVKVFQTDGMVNWDDENNYLEAKKMYSLIEELNKEKQKQHNIPTVLDEKPKHGVDDKLKQEAGNTDSDVKNIKNNVDAVLNKKIGNNNTVNPDKNSVYSENENLKLKHVGTNVGEYKNDEEENQKSVAINDYDFYGKSDFSEKRSLHNQDVDDDVIDLSIVPRAPEIKHNTKSTSNDSEYDDFKFARMLQKAGENVDNLQNFALFSKEAARIASRTSSKQQVLLMPEIKTYNDKNDSLDTSDKDLNANFARADYHKSNFVKQDLYKTDYDKKLHNMYAIAEKINKEKSKTNNNLKKKDSEKKLKLNDNAQNIDDDLKKSSDNVKDENRNNGDENIEVQNQNDGHDLEVDDLNNNSDIEYTKESIEQKQLQAKDIGAPYPLKRSSDYHLTQYQPQNIAQVYHDKDNQHLSPVLFEKNVVEQVIDNLGESNANQIVRALIDKLGKVDIMDDDGNTLLMHAVARKNRPLIAMLLSEGASPNAKNNEGFAPIHLASSNGDDFAVYSLMMSGGNPNLPDNDGNTPLMYAAKMCNDNSIKVMMALGGDPNFVSSSGFTAFDFAKENKDRTIYKLLQEKSQQLYGKTKPIVLND